MILPPTLSLLLQLTSSARLGADLGPAGWLGLEVWIGALAAVVVLGLLAAEWAGAPGAERLHRVIEGIRDEYVVFSSDPDGRITYLSPSVAQVLGRAPDSIRLYTDLLTDSRINRRAVRAMESIGGAERVEPYPIEVRHADGRALEMVVQVTAVRDAAGRLVAFDGIARDVTVPSMQARHAAERTAELERLVDDRTAKLMESARALRESNERLTQLASAVRSLLWIFDPEDERIVFCNTAAEGVLDTSAEEILAAGSWRDGIHPEDRPRFEELWAEMQRQGTYALSYRWRDAPDEDWRWLWERGVARFDALGNVNRVYGTTEDISHVRRKERERLALEAQLLQAQKMETVGQLAGGVAHDFNNLLTVISAHTELMERGVEPGSEIAGSLAAVEDAVAQASRVSRSLLAFSRPAPARPERADIPELVAQIGRMVQRILPGTIEGRIDVPEGSGPYAFLDPSRLQQVLLNLALNARDAMPQGGLLSFVVELGPSGNGDAESILVHVVDTGAGMEPDLQQHIFEPFFTTRAPNQGTGLGLAVAKRIVGEMGGEIGLESAPGEGTTFTIRLPQAEQAREPLQHTAPGGARGRSVLLADDDAQVRSVLASVLDSAGYTVHQVGDGDELLECARRRRASIDLFIVDGDLPRLNGLGCLAQLRTEGLNQPGLLISGSPAEEATAHSLEDIEYLAKPFQLDRMLQAIGRLLFQPKRKSS